MREYERLTRIDEDVDQRVGQMLHQIIQSFELSSSTQNLLVKQVRADLVRSIVMVVAEGLIEKAGEALVAASAKARDAKQVEEEMKKDLDFERVKAFYAQKAELPF